MGIVVTIFMMLGLLVLLPEKLTCLMWFRQKTRFANFIGYGLLVMGLWNSVWYGLQNLQDFWGMAALFSGIVMVSSAFIILVEQSQILFVNPNFFKRNKLLKVVVLFFLFICFLLYAITLIQLNLGYPIIK